MQLSDGFGPKGHCTESPKFLAFPPFFSIPCPFLSKYMLYVRKFRMKMSDSVCNDLIVCLLYDL